MSFTYSFQVPNLLFLEDVVAQLNGLNLNPYNTMYHISTQELDVLYEVELTDLQLSTINQFFQTYVPITDLPKTYSSTSTIQISHHQQSFLDYNLTGSFNYIQTQVQNTQIILSLVSSASCGYQYRLYSLTDNLVLAESTVLTNKVSELQELLIPMITETATILELHVKVFEAGRNANIESAQLNFYI